MKRCKDLEIKRITNLKFGTSKAYLKGNGFALHHKDLGYLSFKSSNDGLKYGVKYPYSPQGGKKALQSILENGGFTNYDSVEWIQPM